MDAEALVSAVKNRLAGALLDVLKDKLPIENYNYSDMKLNSVN